MQYELKKMNGLCSRCGVTLDSDGLECQKCANKQASYLRDKRKEREQNNLCIECGDIVVDKNLCKKHLKIRENKMLKIKEKREFRRNNGLCEQCGNPSLDRLPHLNYKVCEVCYLKKVAKCNLNDITRWSELKELLELQKGLCPYTGEKLILGINTTLDHKFPLSRGGSNSLDNLQWVYFGAYGGFDVNRMKGILTHEEYKSSIEKQYAYLFPTRSI